MVSSRYILHTVGPHAGRGIALLSTWAGPPGLRWVEEPQPVLEAVQVKLPPAGIVFWHLLSLLCVGNKQDNIVSIPGGQSTANSPSHRTIYSFISR